MDNTLAYYKLVLPVLSTQHDEDTFDYGNHGLGLIHVII